MSELKYMHILFYFEDFERDNVHLLYLWILVIFTREVVKQIYRGVFLDEIWRWDVFEHCEVLTQGRRG